MTLPICSIAPGFGTPIRPEAALLQYFRNLASHEVLDVEAEVAATRRISRLEVDRWRVLLAEPPLAATLVRAIRDKAASLSREPALPDLSPLVRAATRAGGNADSGYLRAASRMAQALAEIDHDRELVAAAHESALAVIAAGALRQAHRRTDFVARAQAARLAAEQVKHGFIRANLRLVVVIARRYDRGQMPLIDLIQEGNLGLIKAVDRFDWRRGCRFSTYASWWIRHAIGRAVAAKGHCVRIPVHTLEAQHRLSRVEAWMTRRLGRAPSPEELSAELGLRPDKLDKVARHRVAPTCSIESELSFVDERRYGELLADEELASPFDETLLSAWRDRMGEVLAGLTAIERRVIASRFGLADDDRKTLKQIGVLCNLSRERVRQIEAQALRKMREALDIDAA